MNSTILWNKYRIIREIGNGGMGTVFLAQTIEPCKECAIKQINITARNASLINSEIEILKKLSHPAIPLLWDTIRDGDTLYIVMDYMQGANLQDYIEQYKVIPERQVLIWFKELADILIYLHGLNTPIVYRDLKPNNIIIDGQGHIKLIDFGIASEYVPGERNDMGRALTRGYAAPEQYAKGFTYDVRTDIYALGATVHYLLTGKNPNTPPYVFAPATRLNKEVSLGMENIVQHCLQPNPDDRFVNAIELRNTLEAVDELTAKLQSRKKKRLLLAGVAFVALIVVLIGLFFSIRTRNTAKLNRYYEVVEQVYSQANTDADAALKLCDEADDMNIKSPEASIARAYVYAELEDYTAAMDIVREEIMDTYDDVYANTNFLQLMIKIYAETGQPDEAAYYTELLKEIDG